MANCELCGEPMPAGEEMFKYHGSSGPCPKPPLPAGAPKFEPQHATERQMKWFCKLFGHRWRFDRNEPCGNGWWWEFHKCSRCSAEGQHMVAGPRG